jgi:hypothetical protein
MVLIDQSTSMWKMPIRQGRRSLLSKHIPSASVTNSLRIRQSSTGTTVSGVVGGAGARQRIAYQGSYRRTTQG